MSYKLTPKDIIVGMLSERVAGTQIKNLEHQIFRLLHGAITAENTDEKNVLSKAFGLKDNHIQPGDDDYLRLCAGIHDAVTSMRRNNSCLFHHGTDDIDEPTSRLHDYRKQIEGHPEYCYLQSLGKEIKTGH